VEERKPESVRTSDADDTIIVHKLGLEDVRTREIVLLGRERLERVDAEMATLILVQDTRKDRRRVKVGDTVRFDWDQVSSGATSNTSLIRTTAIQSNQRRRPQIPNKPVVCDRDVLALVVGVDEVHGTFVSAMLVLDGWSPAFRARNGV